MKTNYLFVVAVFFSASCFSQKQKLAIDSLLLVLQHSKEDTMKINLYTNLATAYYSRNIDSFFLFCHMGMDLATKLKRKKNIAQLDLKMSSMLTDTGNYKLSLKYAEESLAIAQELNSKTAIINSYNAIGYTYDFQSDFVTSSEYFFKAMAIAEEINDHEKIAMLGTNLAAAACNQGDFQKAEKYSFITLKEAQIANAPIHTYKALYILGISKATLHDTVSAEYYYNRAIDVCKKNGFITNDAEVVSDLAELQKDDNKKLDLLMQARKIYDTLSPGSFDSRVNWESLGEIYIKMFKAAPAKTIYLSNAEELLNKVFGKSKEANDLASVALALKNMATVQQLKGNYRLAYEYTNQSHSITDSLFSQDNKNKIAGLESKREIDLKNKEIENKELQLSAQRRQNIFFISGLLLLGIIGALLYRQSMMRKKTNAALSQLNSELDEANKVKAKFFGVLSHDLRSPVANLINFLQLQKREPGLLSEKQVTDREQKIASSAESLLETMEATLLWSKSQMEYFKPINTEVTVNSLFSYLQKLFVNSNGIFFSFKNDDNIIINTDENYLKTIIYNLTANAVKALANTPHAKIHWSAWTENHKCFLSIADNGPGIDNEKLKALYDETVTSGSQHGLGLHIIRDLAKAINCSITVKPDEARGTVFILAI